MFPSNSILLLRLDVAPKIGRHEPGEMGDVAGRHNQVTGGDAEGQGLGGEDDVNVQFLRVAGRLAALAGHCPKVGGEEHGGAGDRQKAEDSFQGIQIADADLLVRPQ